MSSTKRPRPRNKRPVLDALHARPDQIAPVLATSPSTLTISSRGLQQSATKEETPMSDPRLHHAANWLSRFTVNGVAASDFHDVLSSLTSWDDWCRAWSARAAVHEGLGREALAESHSSARASISRARR
jgi:hypothetical protein